MLFSTTRQSPYYLYVNAPLPRIALLYPFFSSDYQGCFSDLKAPTRDLPKRFTRYDTTPENCVQECKYQNYKFAGVQYGYLCFCGNAFGRYKRLPDNDCNSKCKGDAFRNCGGYYHNSVYSVGKCEQQEIYNHGYNILTDLFSLLLSLLFSKRST